MTRSLRDTILPLIVILIQNSTNQSTNPSDKNLGDNLPSMYQPGWMRQELTWEIIYTLASTSSKHMAEEVSTALIKAPKGRNEIKCTS